MDLSAFGRRFSPTGSTSQTKFNTIRFTSTEPSQSYKKSSANNYKSTVLTKMMPLKKNIIAFKNPKQPIFTVSDVPEIDTQKHE